MFPQWKLLVVGLVLLGASNAFTYFKGRSDGDALAQADARRQVVEQITERNKINETVSGMSAADLCSELGGVFVNGVCD